jgi:hypothetical protein
MQQNETQGGMSGHGSRNGAALIVTFIDEPDSAVKSTRAPGATPSALASTNTFLAPVARPDLPLPKAILLSDTQSDEGIASVKASGNNPARASIVRSLRKSNRRADRASVDRVTHARRVGPVRVPRSSRSGKEWGGARDPVGRLQRRPKVAAVFSARNPKCRTATGAPRSNDGSCSGMIRKSRGGAAFAARSTSPVIAFSGATGSVTAFNVFSIRSALVPELVCG